MRRLILSAVAVIALAGCGSTAAEDAPAGESTSVTSLASSPAAPVTLTYPAIGVDRVPLEPTGLDVTGAIEVPPLDNPAETNYLDWSAARLAENRATILTSHVNGRIDGKAVPGTFAKLKDAKVGDEIIVAGKDGRSTTYKVRTSVSYPKDQFPTNEVYKQRTASTIVLITCTGEVVNHSYDENQVVTAEATP